MKYSLMLSRALFTTITVLLIVTVTRGDCTPLGVLLSEQTNSACAALEEKTLTKQSQWSIHWPLSQSDTLTPSGTGKCTFRQTCNPLQSNATTDCWPEFHTPVVTSFGVFSILVVSKVTEKIRKNCEIPLAQFDEVWCNDNGQFIFLKSRNCNPQNEEECNSMNWFWNPFSDSCQEEAPPECNLFPEVCENGIWSFQWCGCVPYNTPIVVDLNGNGFDLTNADSGVSFNLNNIGGRERLGWTSASSDDAWLVMDRNGNGTIDDGTELFGDLTTQPNPPAGEKKNGFLALAEYDKISNDGNANGQIESGDSVFPRLRLWRDVNHDGLSEPSELHTLTSLKVAAIELEYKYSKKTDGHGNQFRFRAKVKNSQGQQMGRWAWDVYLVRDSN
jgi:hypothetical protein